jgi:hypothetical protein
MLDEVTDLPVELAGVLVLQVDFILDTVDREGDLLTFVAEHCPVDVVNEFDNPLTSHSAPDSSCMSRYSSSAEYWELRDKGVNVVERDGSVRQSGVAVATRSPAKSVR